MVTDKNDGNHRLNWAALKKGGYCRNPQISMQVRQAGGLSLVRHL